MKKTCTKIIVLLYIVTIVFNIFPLIINAADGSGIEGYIDTIGKSDAQFSEGENFATKVLGTILNVARIIGASVAVIILLYIATKYIIASAGDRADIKKYAVNYVIGAMIFLGASGILTVIRDFIIEG